MKVKWLGHACFLITSAGGMKIITDPYETSESFKYGEIDESADIVTVSHEHGDHNNVAAVRGNPEVVRGTAKVKGIEFKGILTYHDDVEGHPRGKNTILCFGVDGVRVCHLGDLGHPLSDEQVSELGKVDILLAPVGGNFTIDARVATELCDRLKPAVVIPMHYRNDRCPTFPVTGVDEFLRGKEGVKRLDVSEVDFTPGGLPSATQIIVPLPAL
jgi:L-ascorbate metabolism protein UlaG (beta-lactamase superfamily)